LQEPVSKLFWEDFHPGQIFEHGPRRITREEIIEFASEFDPQPMHIDEVGARSTMVGALCASGWQSCCMLMRMSADAFILNSSSMGAPGVDEVKWLAPVRPDDEISLRAEVVETRASKSRPDMGFVRLNFELRNGGGKPVMAMTTSLMMGRRNGGDAAA